MIHGRNLIVSLDGVAIAGAKSCRLSISQEFLKTCSPTASRTFDKTPTIYDWGVSADCLIPASTLSVSLTDKLIKGTKCLLTFTDGSGQKRAGFVYVKNCDESGSVGSLATFSASFESTGELYKYTEYTAAAFTEGNSLEIRADATSITYSFQSSGTSTKGVQITASKKGYVCVIANDSWSLLSDTFSEVKYLINHQDNQSLVTKTIAFDFRNKTVAINAGTYTFLVDDHSAIKKVLLIQ